MSNKRIAWFALTIWMVGAGAPVLHGQSPYSAQPNLKRDGTAVVLEDFADLPLSSPTHGGATTTSINFRAQLGRVNSMLSEPANAPRAASRFFVVDQSSTLYVLDKSSKKFTPYIRFADVFPKFVSDTGNTAGTHLHRV